MFRCPDCHEDHLRITHEVRTQTDVNRDEEVEDSNPMNLTWDSTDHADCLDCGWSGTVADMTVAEPDEDDCELDDDAPGDIDDDGITDPDNERGE